MKTMPKIDAYQIFDIFCCYILIFVVSLSNYYGWVHEFGHGIACIILDSGVKSISATATECNIPPEGISLTINKWLGGTFAASILIFILLWRREWFRHFTVKVSFFEIRALPIMILITLAGFNYWNTFVEGSNFVQYATIIQQYPGIANTLALTFVAISFIVGVILGRIIRYGFLVSPSH